MAKKTKDKSKELAPSMASQYDLGNDTGIKKSRLGGSKDEDLDLTSQIRNNLKYAISHKQTWKEEAEEDIAFAAGDQWDTEDLELLREQGRPALTFNNIKPIINLIAGNMIQNTARIQVYPEGGEDETFSRCMDKVIDHVDKMSNMEFQLSNFFQTGMRAGRAWVEFCIDYEQDPVFGQLKVPLLGPFKIFPDPNGESEYDLSECEFMFKVVKMSKGKLKQLYPEKEGAIDGIETDSIAELMGDHAVGTEGDADNYGIDRDQQGLGTYSVDPPDGQQGDMRQLHVVEYWRKKRVDKWFVYYLEDGSLERFDSEKDAMADVHKRGEDFVQEVDYVTKKRRIVEMHVAVQAGGVILEDGKSPFEPYYNGFPFFHFIPEWIPDADKVEWQHQSFVRSLKDPQREKNKARSQYLHILNTSANSGWIGDDDALSPEKREELTQFGSRPGIVIWKKKGSQLDRIQPVAPDLANQVREKAATDDFKEVSGVNADLLSVDAKASPSGRAIALRIRQAVTILQPAMRNFRYTKQLIGNFLFKIIPMMFDAAKIEKILGQRTMQVNQLDRASIQAYIQMVRDGKYNIDINEAGSAQTLRQETLEDLFELIRAGMPIPPDVVFEFMNMPNKNELITKIKEEQQRQQQAALAQEQAKQSAKQTGEGEALIPGTGAA